MEIFTNPLVLALIPLVVGLVQVVKVVGLPSRFAPAASIFLGVALTFLVAEGVTAVVIGGLVVGLSASGLYSGTRAAIEG